MAYLFVAPRTTRLALGEKLASKVQARVPDEMDRAFLARNIKSTSPHEDVLFVFPF